MQVGLLSRRQNMLALPVERLVGNSSTGNKKDHQHHIHSSRHSLSPDSIVSESSSTISSSSSSSGESHIGDTNNDNSHTNENNNPQSPYTNESRSPSNNNYSPHTCKMHVTMKKSEEASVGATSKNSLISPNSPRNSSSSSPNNRTDNETNCGSNKSYRIPYYRHNNNNNKESSSSNGEKTDSQRSLSPEQQQKNDEVSLVVVKSEVDLDSMNLEENRDEERLRSNKRLSPPPRTTMETTESENILNEKILNGERAIVSVEKSANANRSMNHNGRRLNNNSLHSSAKESFISTSGDHRDLQQQHHRRNDGGSDDEDEQIDIDGDGEEEEEDRNLFGHSKGVRGRKQQRIEEAEDSNNITTSHHHNNLPYNFNYRPPSRPLSTSSSISTASSQSNFKGSNHAHHYFHSHLHPHFSPGSSSTTSFGGGGHHHHHNSAGGQSSSNNNLLKFSIEDILRPDFGLNLSPATSKSRSGPSIFNPFLISPSSSSSQSGIIPNNHPGKLNIHSPSSSSSKPRNGSISSTDGHRPYRPSSVNCHSEDSNGSCKSRNREQEVVDDSKVNPEVPKGPLLWPAWVYCTRYSDRPSSGPRSRRIRKSPREQPEEKRPRTAFTAEQLARLKQEFEENRYLTEKRRQDLAQTLKLHENQIKIWFQNKRAKLKKSTGTKNGLAMQLMAQGLYNHSTVPVDEDEEMEMMM